VIKTETTVAAITEGGAVLMNSKFEKETIAVNTVVLAQTEPDNRLFESLRKSGLKVANIGDSKAVRNVRGAVLDGAEAAYLLDEGLFMNANGVLTNGLPYDVQLQMK
jgi:hypothetical protein